MKTEIKDRLRELRTSAGYTMEALAKMIGVSKAAVGNYEQGIRVPKIEQMEALADIYNVDLDYLYCRSDSSRRISFSEERVLYLMRKLNESGKEEAVKRVKELTYVPAYVVDGLLSEEGNASPGGNGTEKETSSAL